MNRYVKVRGVPGILVPHPSGADKRFAGKTPKNLTGPRDPDMHLADMFDDIEETLQMSTDAMILKAIAKGALEQIGEVVTAKNFDEAEKAFAKGS